MRIRKQVISFINLKIIISLAASQLFFMNVYAARSLISMPRSTHLSPSTTSRSTQVPNRSNPGRQANSLEDSHTARRISKPHRSLSIPLNQGKKLSHLLERYLVPKEKPISVIYKNDPEKLKIAARKDRIKIGIYDTGIDSNHPEIAYKITKEPVIPYRYKDGEKVTERRFPFDYYIGNPWIYHGTSVAGIATHGSDDLEIVPLGDHLMHSDFVGNEVVTEFNLFKGAYKKGVRLFNISLNISDLVFRRIFRAFPDAIFVVSSGNEAKNNDHFIEKDFTRYPNVVVVAAVQSNNFWKDKSQFGDRSLHTLTPFTNYGKKTVQLAALGVGIPAPTRYGGKGIFGGTSGSAPLVTNVCAKIWQINPSLTNRDVIEILKKSVNRDKNLENYLAWGGTLNEEAALQLAKESLENNYKEINSNNKKELELVSKHIYELNKSQNAKEYNELLSRISETERDSSVKATLDHFFSLKPSLDDILHLLFYSQSYDNASTIYGYCKSSPPEAKSVESIFRFLTQHPGFYENPHIPDSSDRVQLLQLAKHYLKSSDPEVREWIQNTFSDLTVPDVEEKRIAPETNGSQTGKCDSLNSNQETEMVVSYRNQMIKMLRTLGISIGRDKADRRENIYVNEE